MLIVNLNGEAPTSIYDSNGHLIDPIHCFPHRNGMVMGDSVSVVKGTRVFTGTIYVRYINSVYPNIIAKSMTFEDTYQRYDQIKLFANNKLLVIDRLDYSKVGVIDHRELAVYYSKTVLTEKYLNPAFLKKVQC